MDKRPSHKELWWTWWPVRGHTPRGLVLDCRACPAQESPGVLSAPQTHNPHSREPSHQYLWPRVERCSLGPAAISEAWPQGRLQNSILSVPPCSFCPRVAVCGVEPDRDMGPRM